MWFVFIIENLQWIDFPCAVSDPRNPCSRPQTARGDGIECVMADGSRGYSVAILRRPSQKPRAPLMLVITFAITLLDRRSMFYTLMSRENRKGIGGARPPERHGQDSGNFPRYHALRGNETERD